MPKNTNRNNCTSEKNKNKNTVNHLMSIPMQLVQSGHTMTRKWWNRRQAGGRPFPDARMVLRILCRHATDPDCCALDYCFAEGLRNQFPVKMM